MPRPHVPDGGSGQACFDQGALLYRAGYWWEAHEAWERLWRRLPRQSPRRLLVQGLILLAASQLKAWCGRPEGSRLLAQRALDRLRRAEAALPPGEAPYGLAPSRVIEALERWQAAPLPAPEHEAVRTAAPKLPAPAAGTGSGGAPGEPPQR